MKIFTVFMKSHSDTRKSQVIFVTEGFSISAAICNIFWAIYHNSLLSALVILLINAINAYLLSIGYLDQGSMGLIHVAVSLIFGFIANDLRQIELTWRGYKIIDIIYAGGKEEAKYKYIGNQLKSI